MNHRHSHSFTLVEILLALGVIMIGVVSLMGLFPAAAKVTADATMETYASNALEELSAYIADCATRRPSASDSNSNVGWGNWISGGTKALPASEPSAMLNSSGNESAIGTAEENETEVTDGNKWEQIQVSGTSGMGVNKFLFAHKTKNGVFLLVSVRGLDKDGNIIKDDGTTGAAFDITNADHQEKIDARVLITVWKTPITRLFKAGGAEETDNSYGYGARINLKAGWPAERPEAKRTELSGGGHDWVALRRIKTMTFDLHKPISY